MKKQSGFTMIELIMVIVILGILAAVALPRFTDLAKDARIAKLNAARSAVLAASSILHGTVLARGRADTAVCPGETIANTTANNLPGNNDSATSLGTVCTENGVVSLKFGYPIAGTVGGATVATTGIINAAGLTPVFRPTLAQLNTEGYGAVVSPITSTTTVGNVTFSVIGGSGTDTAAAGAQANTTCSFTYTEPTAQGAAPVISEVTTTGC